MNINTIKGILLRNINKFLLFVNFNTKIFFIYMWLVSNFMVEVNLYGS